MDRIVDPKFSAMMVALACALDVGAVLGFSPMAIIMFLPEGTVPLWATGWWALWIGGFVGTAFAIVGPVVGVIGVVGGRYIGLLPAVAGGLILIVGGAPFWLFTLMAVLWSAPFS